MAVRSKPKTGATRSGTRTKKPSTSPSTSAKRSTKGTNAEARFANFARDLSTLAEDYEIDLVGTCFREGVYGEITLIDRNDPKASGWQDVEGQIGYGLRRINEGGRTWWILGGKN